jgi:hypothetical protein
MEQVLYRLHVKIMTNTSRYTTHESRRLAEFVCLFLSVCSLLTLGLLHITYIVNSTSPKFNCLLNAVENYQMVNPSLDNIRNDSSPFNMYGIKITADPAKQQSVLSRIMQRFSSSEINCPKAADGDPTTCSTENELFLPETGEYIHVNSYEAQSNNFLSKSQEYNYLFTFERGILMLSQEFTDSLSLTRSYNFNVLEIEIDRGSKCFGPKITNRLVDLTKSLDVIIMNWAIQTFDGKGFLYSTKTKELLNLNYAKQYVAKKGIQLHEMGRRESYHKSQSNNYLNMYLKIFQTYFSPSLRKNSYFLSIVFFFYDWLDGVLEILIESVRSHAVFRFLVLNRFDELSSQDLSSHDLTLKILNLLQQYLVFRIGVIFSTTFLFFICTSLVAYILRQTQEKMVRFTFLLQYHVTHDLDINSLIFTHVTESLVFVPIMMGIYFFLFEFFSDQLVRISNNQFSLFSYFSFISYSL